MTTRHLYVEGYPAGAVHERPRKHVCDRITYHYYDNEQCVVITYLDGVQTMRPMTPCELRHAEQARIVRLTGLQIVRAAFGRPWRRWLPTVIWLLLGLVAVIAGVDFLGGN